MTLLRNVSQMFILLCHRALSRNHTVSLTYANNLYSRR